MKYDAEQGGVMDDIYVYLITFVVATLMFYAPAFCNDDFKFKPKNFLIAASFSFVAVFLSWIATLVFSG